MRWLLLVAVVLSAPAFADYIFGNELYSFLQQEETTMSTHQSANEAGIGRGYVSGVQDAFNGTYFCVPPKVKLSQAIDITRNYLKAHPEQRHEAAKTLVVWALSEKFPCPKGAK